MSRPLTRNQILENEAFLRHLRRTGNARLSARTVGKAYSTMQERRARHPAFALKWDVAVAHASARLHGTGGERRPERRAAGPEGAHRTVGGEPVVIRLESGRLQVRAAQPGKLTRACEQAFLLALSATANVRLSAAAAGAAEAAFFRRKRNHPGFAREWLAALSEGYARLEAAVAAGFLPENHEDDAWRHNDARELLTVTANQALQLLYLHQKEVLLVSEPLAGKRRRSESTEAYNVRLALIGEARLEREREKFRVAEAQRRAAREAASPHEVPIVLPQLDQVTGWSKADPDAVPHEEGVALFGGFRVKHLTEDELRKARRGREAAWWGAKLTGPKRVRTGPKRGG